MVLGEQKQKELLSELSFIERSLSKWNRKVEDSKALNLGIFYGLVLGLLGNLLITLVWDLGLKEASVSAKIILALVVLVFVSFIVIICNLEHKKLQKMNNELDQKLNEIELDRDKIEKGIDSITHSYLYRKYIPL